MLCCAALILVIGLLREAWFRLPGTRRREEPGFAPVATWPRPAPEAETRHTNRAGYPLLGFGAGVVLYGISVYLLLWTGLLTAHDTSPALWVGRDIALAVLAATCVMVSRRVRGGTSLLGVGTAFWLLGLVDMHALGLFEVAGGSLGWDLVFHGFGAALVVAGALPTLTVSLPKELSHVH